MLKSLKLCFVEVSDIILDFRGYFLFLNCKQDKFYECLVSSNMFTSADLHWSCNELCIAQGLNLVANVFWQSFLIWGLGSQAWNFPNKCGIKRSRRSYYSNICQIRCYFLFHKECKLFIDSHGICLFPLDVGKGGWDGSLMFLRLGIFKICF